MRPLNWIAALMIPASSAAFAQEPPPPRPAEANIVYGMVGGAALLMDFYRPAKGNGKALLYIPGCGWYAPLTYGTPQLKDINSGNAHADAFNRSIVQPLLDAGYTVFILNHRAAPRFHYPDALDDARRAVRFIRHHAGRLGIDPAHLGGVGCSSGGHLVELLGLTDGSGNANDEDAVERESSKLQCIVAGAAPSDLTYPAQPEPRLTPAITSFLGATTQFVASRAAPEYRTALEASPIAHVSPDDPPCLLFHGENDEAVPIRHAEWLAARLQSQHVPVRLLRIPNASHLELRPPGGPDFTGAMIEWFNVYLRGENGQAGKQPGPPPKASK